VIGILQEGLLPLGVDVEPQAVARSYGLPWVYEMRGVLECTWVASRPVSQQAEALSSERFALLRAKEAEMARRSDAVVVLSQVQAEDLAARALASQRVRKFLDGEPAKIVVRAPRLVNIVP